MNSGSRVVIVFFISLAMLEAVVALDPFALASEGLALLFRGGPDWTKVENLYRDGSTQEVTVGDDPLSSLSGLGRMRSDSSNEQLIYLIGNSQSYTTILAPGEQRTRAPEMTYPDLINERYRRMPGANTLVYRLSAPNISYPEALWYVDFITTDARLRAHEIALQLNYESFRKTGIRDGMLGLLAVPEFWPRVQAEAGSGAPYADVFRQALQRYATLKPRKGSDRPSPSGSGAGVGVAIEDRFRSTLSHIPGFDRRHELKGNFLNLLYLSRVYFLQIKPTTPRSIGGPPLRTAQACLSRIATLCHENNVNLVLFSAPQNPAAVLYRTAEDRTRYITATRGWAASNGILFFDFESSIPGPLWGQWIDGPDPIHFGRHAHQLMAELMIRSGMLR